jgi:acetyltransferase
VGGVRLRLADASAVRRAFREIEASVKEKVGPRYFSGVTVQPMIEAEGYEIIVGSSIDPQFGPVLLFGSGGELAEILGDRAVALPPLNSTLARRMMEQTRVFAALKGVRGRKPVDLSALEQLMVHFGQLVVEQRRIKEIDINPLLASADQLIVLDARVILHEPDVEEHELPKLAIRPYPTQYVTSWTMKDGTPVTIRPIRPEDEPLMAKFHETLSERSVYLRYFQALKLSRRISHELLSRASFIDYDRKMALVTVREDPKTRTHEILALGQLSKLRTANEAEVAVLVSDQYQGQGLGTELLRRLIRVARDERLSRLIADVLPENRGMLQVARKLGFSLRPSRREGVVKVTMDL